MEKTGTAGTGKVHYAWFILVASVAFYAVTTGILCNTAGIFATPVMEETGWDRTSTTFYLTIFPLVAAVMQPIAGQLMQRLNPRYLLTAAVGIFCIAYMLTSQATQVWHWNLFGVAYGITAAFFMYLATPVLINAWFKKRTGLCLGITGAALSLFAAFASPIGNNLIQSVGWRQTRLIFGIVGFCISVPLTFIFVRKRPEDKGLKPYGYDEAEAEAEAAAAAAKTGEDPGATLSQAIKSPAFYLLILTAGIFCMCASFFQQIPSFAATGNLGSAAGAMAVSIMMVGGIIGKFLLGNMNDAFGIRPTGIIACLCGALGIFLAFISGANVVLFYIGMAVFGVGYSALTIVSPMVTQQSFGPKEYSKIYSWIATSIFLWSALAPLLYARIFDITGSFNLCFILVICMYLLGAVLVPTVLSLGKKIWSK